MFTKHTHSRTFCTVFSCMLPNLENNCRTRSRLRQLSARTAEIAPVQYKSSNGWEFLYGWVTPNKTSSWRHCSVLLFNVGRSISVPSTPSEVNGLMDGPWTKRFIHPNPPFTEDFTSTRMDKDWDKGQGESYPRRGNEHMNKKSDYGCYSRVRFHMTY